MRGRRPVFPSIRSERQLNASKSGRGPCHQSFSALGIRPYSRPIVGSATIATGLGLGQDFALRQDG